MLTLIHNNSCSKSNCLNDYLIQNSIPYQLRDYLNQPLSGDELRALIQRLQANDDEFDIKSLIRTSDPSFLPLAGLDIENIAEVVSLLHKRPELLQRPILYSETKAVIGRPFEKAIRFLSEEFKY